MKELNIVLNIVLNKVLNKEQNKERPAVPWWRQPLNPCRLRWEQVSTR